MPARNTSLPVPLPKGWTKVVNSAVLHAISLAANVLTAAWGRAAGSRSSRLRDRAEIDRLRTELALLKEELEIKDARWARLHPRRRPHYWPIQRLRILKLRAARGWTVVQTAERFILTEETVSSWKYIIADKGKPFFCEAFREWCKGRTIGPRFGAVGKHGSIASIERSIRSMKSECTTRILVPLDLAAMRRELALYIG